MNERLDLAALRDDLDLPATRVATGRGTRGRRRVRRRRTAVAAVAAALVVAVAVVPSTLTGQDDEVLQPAGPGRPRRRTRPARSRR